MWSDFCLRKMTVVLYEMLIIRGEPEGREQGAFEVTQKEEVGLNGAVVVRMERSRQGTLSGGKGHEPSDSLHEGGGMGASDEGLRGWDTLGAGAEVPCLGTGRIEAIWMVMMGCTWGTPCSGGLRRTGSWRF